MTVATRKDEFARDGVLVIDRLLDDGAVLRGAEAADRLLVGELRQRAGARRVLERSPVLAALAREPTVVRLAEELAGKGARVVRSLLFDKSDLTNWLVPWHQDPTIAVRQRLEVAGFGPWSSKEGEHHCQPPVEVLRSIVVIRVHLDACAVENGPLRVVAGSHRNGILRDDEMVSCVQGGHVVEGVTAAGGGLVMSPLSVHSSAKSSSVGARRRVLHLEFSSAELPCGLAWGEC